MTKREVETRWAAGIRAACGDSVAYALPPLPASFAFNPRGGHGVASFGPRKGIDQLHQGFGQVRRTAVVEHRFQALLGASGGWLGLTHQGLAFVGEAHGISARIETGAFALDQASAQEPLDNLGHGRSIDTGDLDEARLANVPILGNGDQDSELPRSESGPASFIIEDTICDLTGSVEEMRDRCIENGRWLLPVHSPALLPFGDNRPLPDAVLAIASTFRPKGKSELHLGRQCRINHSRAMAEDNCMSDNIMMATLPPILARGHSQNWYNG
jgi:hypothetical protein